MSLKEYYKKPVTWKSAEVAALNTTTTIWSPTSGTRVVLDKAIVSSYGASTSTVALYFGADSLANAPTRITLFNLNTTTCVMLDLGGIENGRQDEVVRAITAATPISVTLIGYEI